MKIRQGFVSNSSSSSFIVVAAPIMKDKLNKTEAAIQDTLDKGYEIFSLEDYNFPHNAVGLNIVDFDEEEVGFMDAQKVMNIINDFRDNYDGMMSLSLNKTRIYYGTRFT